MTTIFAAQTRLARRPARVGVVLCALLLASCAVVDKAGQASGERTGRQTPMPAPTPTKPTEPPPPAPPPPPPLAPVDVGQLLVSMRSHLDLGQEDEAMVDLRRVLEVDPDNRIALSYQRQIQDDPKVLYGRASQPYRVVAGDTLATIAHRGLADREQFYGLARYNGIKVPRDLKVGQVIQVPGRRPLVPPADKAPTTDDHKAADDKKSADEKQAAEEKRAAEQARAAQEKKAADARHAAIERHTKAARTALAKQDLCGAIKAWDAVLGLDPENLTAQLERKKALDMKARLPSSKC